VDPDEFEECVEGYIEEISACSPLALRFNKKAVRNFHGQPFSEAMNGVTDLFMQLVKTEDVREGIASFYGKRKPVWPNRMISAT